MKTMLTIVVSVILSTAGTYILVSYVPLSFFPDIVKHLYGTTITTINGSDTISGSRTVINTNFSNLNTDKLENSLYYATTTHKNISSLPALTTAGALVTVGTITSGTWNATTLTSSFGGTGSTTLSSNQILLGNGTGILKTVNGFGNSGQFLTSQGAATAPTWTSGSIDTTLSYNWTGTNLFKTLKASSTIEIGGTSYTFPSTNGASSTVWANNGSGTFVNSAFPDLVLYQNTPNTGTSNTATTTLGVATIPGGSFGTSNKSLRISGLWYFNAGGSGTCWPDIEFGNGVSTTTLGFTFDTNTGIPQQLSTLMYATSTTGQASFTVGVDSLAQGNPNVNHYISYSALTGYNLASNTYVAFSARSSTGGGTCTFIGGTVELLTQ